MTNQVTSNGTSNGTTNGRSSAAASNGKEPSDFVMLPAVDVVEDVNGITLFADLPGVPKDQLDIKVDAEMLTIEGVLTLPTPEGMAAQHAEVRLSRYRRSFSLSKELDAEKIDAEFAQGVLRLHIPKAENAKPRRITISAH
jgi:HSP20 family molecular chaperone IbpA